MNLPEGQERMVWLIDFTGWSLANSVPIKTARDTINILQNHYPERLGVAFLYSPPRIFETFWKVKYTIMGWEKAFGLCGTSTVSLSLLMSWLVLQIVKFFLDPKTFQKVKFVYSKNEESLDLMKQNFDEEVLPSEFGGNNQYHYDHEEFSRLMAKDDVKSAAMWGIDDKLSQTATSNGHASAEVAPEPVHLTPPVV